MTPTWMHAMCPMGGWSCAMQASHVSALEAGVNKVAAPSSNVQVQGRTRVV